MEKIKLPPYFIFKGIVILLPVLVMLLFSEMILRIYGPKYYKFNNKSNEYYTNPRGYYMPLRKEGKYIIYGLNYCRSNEGYRLPQISPYGSVDKESSILGLGDSFTFGRGVKYEDVYLTLLENLLSKDGYKIGINNCGKCGVDIEDIFGTYMDESSRRIYPLVIYGFVLNDFGLPVKDKIVGLDFIDFNNGGYTFNTLRKILRFHNFICYIIEKRRLHNITLKAYLEAFKGENAKKKFEILRQLNQSIKAKNSRLIIVLFPLLYNLRKYPFSEISEKLSCFCEKEGILLLDLLPAFSKYKVEDLWANPTDHHPNEIAHKITAEELYKFLKQNRLLNIVKNTDKDRNLIE